MWEHDSITTGFHSPMCLEEWIGDWLENRVSNWGNWDYMRKSSFKFMEHIEEKAIEASCWDCRDQLAYNISCAGIERIGRQETRNIRTIRDFLSSEELLEGVCGNLFEL